MMKKEQIQLIVDEFLSKNKFKEEVTVLDLPEIEEPENLAEYIDHTILKATATKDEIEKVCDEAVEYKFRSVCVNPFWINLVREKLSGEFSLSCVVIGFPLGANTTATKAFETINATESGAKEIDMVLNVGALKTEKYIDVLEDIKAVVESAANKAIVKVILETCYLTDEEIIYGTVLSKLAGAHFVKTSTGFGTDGAKEKHISIMRMIAGDSMGVKASGGVRTKEDALKMIKAGATRIGASSSIDIVK
jgi:deoxyribose-phosphate aldolase